MLEHQQFGARCYAEARDGNRDRQDGPRSQIYCCGAKQDFNSQPDLSGQKPCASTLYIRKIIYENMYN